MRALPRFRSAPIRPAQLVLALLFASVLALASAASYAFACGFASPDETRQLSMSIGPNTDRTIHTNLWKVAGGDDSCTASMQVELSAFPSSRLATRPHEVAAALRETADEWGVKSCTVYVSYTNDTKEEFASHELCVLGEFRFDKGDYWSASSEGYCWEPMDVDVVIETDGLTDLPG